MKIFINKDTDFEKELTSINEVIEEITEILIAYFENGEDEINIEIK